MQVEFVGTLMDARGSAMTVHVSPLTRMLSVLAASSTMFAFSVAHGQAVSPMPANAHPSFEVATIRPGDPSSGSQGFHINGHRLLIENETACSLMMFAYGLHRKQIVGAPDWCESERYDIAGVPDLDGQPNLRQMQEMLRKLIDERLDLKSHHARQELSVYALTVAKGGPKLTPSVGSQNDYPDQTGNGNDNQKTMRFTNNSMANFALGMQPYLDKPVLDQTALTGKFDFLLKWTPVESQTSNPDAPPNLFTAIQEELGLKLEATKGLTDVLVIDHIERPSAN